MSWKFLNYSRSRSLFLCVCRQLRWTSATELFVFLNRRLCQAQLVHRKNRGGGTKQKIERRKQIHLLFLTLGFLWLRLLTPHVCSAQAPIHTVFWRGKDQGERKKIGWRNEEKSQKQTAGDSIWMMSLLACSLVCVQARHKPGISAAMTFPEPEFESTTNDCEAAQMLLLLLWSHDPCVWIAKVFFFKQRFRQAFICSFVAQFTLIQTSDPEWFIIFGDPLILNIIL